MINATQPVLLGAAAVLLCGMASPPGSAIKPSDRVCDGDGDCVTVIIGCDCCGVDDTDFEAVNRKFLDKDVRLEYCSEKDIAICEKTKCEKSVPPAECHEGRCIIMPKNLKDEE